MANNEAKLIQFLSASSPAWNSARADALRPWKQPEMPALLPRLLLASPSLPSNPPAPTVHPPPLQWPVLQWCLSTGRGPHDLPLPAGPASDLDPICGRQQQPSHLLVLLPPEFQFQNQHRAGVTNAVADYLSRLLGITLRLLKLIFLHFSLL